MCVCDGKDSSSVDFKVQCYKFNKEQLEYVFWKQRMFMVIDNKSYDNAKDLWVTISGFYIYQFHPFIQEFVWPFVSGFYCQCPICFM